MTDVKKTEKQRTRMNPGWEDNEGNELPFALGMKLLCSPTPMSIQYPRGHRNCSWHSFLSQVPRHLQVGVDDAEHFRAFHPEGWECSPFPHVARCLPITVVLHNYMIFSVINRSAGQVLTEHQEIPL